MEIAEIQERVKEVIIDTLGVEDEEVTPEAILIDDLGADSLDTVELVMNFEEEFNIDIDEKVAAKILTVEAAVNRIAEYLD